MGERDVLNAESKRSRIVYGRDDILALKKIENFNFPDDIPPICSSVLRSNRGRTKANSFSLRCQNDDRPRDTSTIVLGPQKRTWNTGCHVSYPAPGSETVDSTSFFRWGKSNADYHATEKQYSKSQGEYKRDFRSSDNRGSTRGRSREPYYGRHDGIPFTKPYARDIRDNRVSRSYGEDEPEWFSEGPMTVNETIELGEILEDPIGRPPNSEGKKSLHELEAGDYFKCNNVRSPDHNVCEETQHDANRKGVSSFLTDVSPVQSLSDNENVPVENQGSRFKHLFSQSESTDDKAEINKQLLKLLTGSTNNRTSLSSPDTNNVIQVENKLRSILLGHSSTSDSQSVGNNELKKSKPKVLTVEEIEAQLRLPQGDFTDDNSVNGSIQSRIDPMNFAGIEDSSIKSFTPSCENSNSVNCSQLETNAGLIPLLQSLIIKQKSVQQSLHLRNSFPPFGLFPTPMTNAVSASARINQLQHYDVNTTLGIPDDIATQGTLSQLWNNYSNDSSVQPLLQPPVQSNPILSSSINSHLYSDSTQRSIAPNFSHLSYVPPVPSRRPIVKAQHNFVNTAFNGLSFNSYGVMNPSMTMEPPIQQEISNRNTTTAIKHCHLTAPGSLKSQLRSLAIDMRANAYQFPNSKPSTSSSFSSVALHSIDGGVAQTQSQNVSVHPMMRTGADNVKLLSNLADFNRTKTANKYIGATGFDILAGIKAKTLEEIERQDISRNDSYY